MIVIVTMIWCSRLNQEWIKTLQMIFIINSIAMIGGRQRGIDGWDIVIGVAAWRSGRSRAEVPRPFSFNGYRNLLRFYAKNLLENKWIHTVCKWDAVESFYWKTWRTDENGAATLKISPSPLWNIYRGIYLLLKCDTSVLLWLVWFVIEVTLLFICVSSAYSTRSILLWSTTP